MSLMDSNSNGIVMPVGPMYGNGGFGGSSWAMDLSGLLCCSCLLLWV